MNNTLPNIDVMLERWIASYSQAEYDAALDRLLNDLADPKQPEPDQDDDTGDRWDGLS